MTGTLQGEIREGTEETRSAYEVGQGHGGQSRGPWERRQEREGQGEGLGQRREE